MRSSLKPVDQRREDALSRISWQELECPPADHYRLRRNAVEHVSTGGSASRFDGRI